MFGFLPERSVRRDSNNMGVTNVLMFYCNVMKYVSSCSEVRRTLKTFGYTQYDHSLNFG